MKGFITLRIAQSVCFYFQLLAKVTGGIRNNNKFVCCNSTDPKTQFSEFGRNTLSPLLFM